ncbi:MAG TPA: phosphatase PAP2 family protein [Stellaceae bacterium]|nr:phosphatase PAP2 family protein [Stellaceae bacterium]
MISKKNGHLFWGILPTSPLKASMRSALYWAAGLLLLINVFGLLNGNFHMIVDGVQWLDISFTHAINKLARRSEIFDQLVFEVSGKNLIKMVPLVTVLWWAWFHKPIPARHELVIKGFLAALFAVAVSRTLIFQMPMRLRPLHDPAMGFVMPYGPPESILEHWSSFPSDHAAVACALATAIFLCSRRLGVAAFVWAALVVSLPRLYLGFHYLSDVLAGGAIGVAAMLTLAWLPTPKRLGDALGNLETRHAGVFYVGFFLMTYQLSTMFEDVRSIGHQGVNIIFSLLGRS